MAADAGPFLPLFPVPKELKRQNGALKRSPLPLGLGPGLSGLQERLLTDLLHPSEVSRRPSLPEFAFTFGAPVGARRAALRRTDHFELKIQASGILARGSNRRALTYAIHALGQVCEASLAQLPAISLKDWADTRERIFHLDLKGGMPLPAVLEEWLLLLSECRYSALLVEYEDKFPYRSHPKLVAPQALGPAQQKALVEQAEALGMEMIPLLQSLAHVEYILREPKYVHLREEPDQDGAEHPLPVSQFCPLKPESARLFEDLATELIRAHPHSTRFHIGADEARELGTCPQCRDYCSRHGREALYMTVVDRACGLLERHGLGAMAWDDMFRDMANEQVRLPKNLALNYWLYSTRPDNAPAKEFPFLDTLLEHHRPVYGVACVRGADGAAPELPNVRARLDNVLSWARLAEDRRLPGLIMSSWARYTTLTIPCEPFDASWPVIAAAAGMLWNVPLPGDAEPAQRAALASVLAAFHGVRDRAALERSTAELLQLGGAPRRANGHRALDSVARRHRHLLELTALFEKSHKVFFRIERLLVELDLRLARLLEGGLAAYEGEFYRKNIRHFLGELEALKPALEAALRGRLCRADADEYVASRFHRAAHRLKGHLALLSKEPTADARTQDQSLRTPSSGAVLARPAA